MTAEDIIRGVLEEGRMARFDLCHGKTHRYVKARLLAIHKLRQAGFGKAAIARAMDKTRGGIDYWFKGQWEGRGHAVKWRVVVDGCGWDAKTNSIVLQVCKENKIYPAELFGAGRDKRLTSARREAMRRLSEVGFTNAAIARVLKLNYTTVRYWTRPKVREYSRRIARESLARSQARAA